MHNVIENNDIKEHGIQSNYKKNTLIKGIFNSKEHLSLNAIYIQFLNLQDAYY